MTRQFLNGKYGNIKQVNPYLISVLYAMDRWQTKNKLNSWLKKDKIVILNRYTTSNLIHQTIKLPKTKQKKFINWIEQMEYQILKLPKPDLIIYLYLPYHLSCALIKKRGRKQDIHEKNLNHLKKAATFGLKLAKKRKSWFLIKCHNKNKIYSREKIADQVWQKIQKKLKK